MLNMTRGAAWGLLILFCLLGAGTAFNFITTQRLVAQSQRQWCNTLTLITSNGPPKPGTANYRRGLVFYDHLKMLERHFGC